MDKTSKILDNFILPGLKYLPIKMDSIPARVMLLSIGLQESGFSVRKQMGGPARSFWQFEQGGGVTGILKHPSTSDIIRNICGELKINPIPGECYEAITYNDILACCFARLLLWTLPDSLPKRGEYAKGWEIYIKGWRPGKPRYETWDDYFNLSWSVVNEK